MSTFEELIQELASGKATWDRWSKNLRQRPI